LAPASKKNTFSKKWACHFRQMHSWDYSGPYHGYDGFAIFARDMDMTINNPCWKSIKAPWKTEAANERSGESSSLTVR
jgi:nitrogenase molybdenum-iron protein alpha chain